MRIEKFKKNHDIQTFKEIIAFSEGRTLNEMQKNQELGKRSYQKTFLVIGISIITFVIAIIELGILLYFR